MALLGGAAAAWPLAARTQPDRVRRVGVLMSAAEGDAPSVARLAAFRQKLETLGWTVGRNLQIDYRWEAFDPERAKVAVSELLRLSPDVIIANSVSATQAAKQATHTVPIIFTVVSEPISLGFVASLSHPGGNITGFTTLEPSIATRWLELLKEIAPEITRAAFMFNPASTRVSALFYKSIQVAASKLLVEPEMLKVGQPEEIETSLAGLGERSGLIVQPDTFLNVYRRLIFQLGGSSLATGRLSLRLVRAGRWSDGLRTRHSRPVSACCELCRPNSSRCKSCRLTGAATHQIRDGHQPQGCEATRSHRAAKFARRGRRRDRITTTVLRCISLVVAHHVISRHRSKRSLLGV